MSEKDKEGLDRRIKRLRIFDKLIIAFAKHKIVFKQPDDEKHYTADFLNERGILDFHETIEGKEEEKQYPWAEKLDLKKLGQAIRQTFESELLPILKEIDINNPRYKDVVVYIPPEKEAIEKATEIKRRDIVFKESRFLDLMKDLAVPMKDLENYDFKVAFFSEEGDESALYRIHGKYFLLKLRDLEELMNKIYEKSRV